ncbi:MAG: hypothetical protein Q8N48_02975 [Thiobacillus sp.]|nr:hypothetical protein [Thiobacillus sp.]MDP2253642.1 hypothetical protein [Thiobacillus sp.]MDP2977772.1 hypothetical protein [Thiobacillus sp.]
MALTSGFLFVASVPMLLHRKVDFATALVASFMATRHNFRVLLWSVPIAGLTAVGAATNFIAMAVIFPWLGHASWHACRGLIEHE